MKRIYIKLKTLIISYKKKIKFLFSSNFKSYKKKQNKSVILLDTPEHGNIGDAAIALAETRYINDNFPEYDFFEFTFNDCSVGCKYIKKYICNEDILIVHGGGFIGTLWKNEQNNFIHILNSFINHRICVMPQTVYFDDDYEIDRFKNVLSHRQSETVFFLRDKESYFYMNNNFKYKNISYYLVPDIVTYLKGNSLLQRNQEVLFCIRSDKEKLINTNELNNVKKLLIRLNLSYTFSDTVIPGNISPNDRISVINTKLQEFSRSALVITDRLHGMLFSLITGTPCIALDNISHKVSGQYEWLKHLSHIENCNVNEIDIDKILILLNSENIYDNSIFEKYYVKMKKVISNN